MALQLPGDQHSTEWTSLFWALVEAPDGRLTSWARFHTPATSLATKL